MKDFGDHEHDGLFGTRTAEVRQEAGYRMPVHKPRAVRVNAERANQMIRLYGAGRVGEAVAMAEEDRARRNEQIRFNRANMTEAERAAADLAREQAKAENDARALRGAELVGGRPIIVVYRGKEMRLHEAVELGYVPLGIEGKQDD